ncbi:MAG: hypothetical protein V2A79_01900 [Planctomycetota bacterium]
MTSVTAGTGLSGGTITTSGAIGTGVLYLNGWLNFLSVEVPSGAVDRGPSPRYRSPRPARRSDNCQPGYICDGSQCLPGEDGGIPRYSAAGKAWRFAAGMAAFSAAVLIRPQVLLIGPALWLFSFSVRRPSWRAVIARGLWFIIPLGLLFGWLAWSEHLNAVYAQGREYFAFRIDWPVVREALTKWIDGQAIFGFLLPNYVMNWTLFPALAVGLALSFRREHRRLTAGAMLQCGHCQ